MAHWGSCPLARQDGPLPPRPWRWECRGDNREPGLSSQDRGPEVGIGGVALAGGHISRTPTRSRARARGLPEGFPVTRLTWSRRVLRSRMRLGVDQGGFLEFRVGCSRHSARGWGRASNPSDVARCGERSQSAAPSARALFCRIRPP